MKRLSTVILLFLILAFSDLKSFDPYISYIIPDIGSPGMNTYIEIIGPMEYLYCFGTDSLYFNNPTDPVRVELVRAADASKVTIGPLLVSWKGRMISTQIFVKPNVSPNSTNWQALNSEFRIPIRVFAKGTYSNVDTIYIVQPQHLGDISSNSERVLGQGTLGIRSRRGAMIIDSLKLATGGTYTVSVNDCDPNTPGNQGYLPIVLLSKGSIYGGSLSTIISVNSGSGGLVPNAGPGGGGGGGRFCDATLFNFNIIGDDGGSGYVGGGAGGRNRSGIPGADDAYKNTGEGTFVLLTQRGYSLNLTVPPANAWYEASGGATGHPFGISGYGCNDGNNCNPEGMYGGGSGYRQNQQGGSAGYGTSGTGSSTLNGGKVHGNTMVVPIAGGSGGASGNPQSGGNCSGSGGGGGGAIRLFGRDISSLRVTANGGNGGDGASGSYGGNGSGGHVNLQGKLRLYDLWISAPGGTRNSRPGGAGRLRTDGPATSLTMDAPATTYQGLSSDTTSFVLRIDTVRGSFQPSRSLRLFLKPETGNWQELSTPNTTSSNWLKRIDFTGTDTLYYFTSIQDVSGRDTNSLFTYIPFYVMSQAAANIFQIEKTPKIGGDSLCTFKVINCDNSFDLDTAYINNGGDAALRLQMNAAQFTRNNRGFELVSPTTSYGVNPNDTVPVIIKFSYQAGQRGIIYDTLLIPHNDVYSGKNPWKIYCSAKIDTLSLKNLDINITRFIDTLDLGKVCINGTKDSSYIIRNDSEADLTLEGILSLNSIFIPDFLSSTQVNKSETATIGVTFSPTAVGKVESKIFVRIVECDDYVDTLIVKGEGVTGKYIFENTPDTLDIGSVCVGSSVLNSFIIRNVSITGVNIESPTVSDNINFSANIEAGTYIEANDTMSVYVQFTPSSLDTFVTKVYVRFKDCGGYIDSIYVRGYAVKAQIDINELKRDYNIDFKGTCLLYSKDSIVTLINKSGFDVTIDKLTMSDPSYFKAELLSNPFMPIDDTALVKITFKPDLSTPVNATIYINTVNCSGLDSVYVTGLGTISIVRFSDNPVVFKDTKVGKRDTIIIGYKNIGKTEAYIEYMPILPSPFRILEVIPTIPRMLNPGDSLQVKIEFAPSSDENFQRRARFESVLYKESCPDTTILNLEGNGVRSKIQVSSFILQYGLLAWCETVQDSVIIKNTGTGAFRITEQASIVGNDINNFVIAQGPLNPTPTLQSGDSVIYYIRFVPKDGAEGVKTAQLLIKTDDPEQAEIRIDLVGEKENIDIEWSVTSLDFGTVAIGSTSEITVTLQNKGRLMRRLYAVKSSHPDITVAPQGGNIDPGGSIDLTATFKPTSEGTVAAQLDFYFNIPCPDTLMKLIILSGEGKKGTILYSNPIDFGVITPCESSLDSVVIQNTGSVAFKIVDSMRIEGGDYTNFKFENSITYPITLQPTEKFSRKIVFTANNTEGIKQSDLIIRIYIDGDTVEYKSKLIGTSQIGLEAIPDHLDFGNIVINTTSTLSFVLKNNGINNVTITSLLPYPLLGIYILSPVPNTVLPKTINPGDSIIFAVEFHPTIANQDYYDTLRFAIEEKGCEWERKVYLSGRGYPSQKLRLRLPELLNISPNIDNYRIPVYGMLDNSTSTIDGVNLEAEFSMNGTLFYPTAVEPGTLTNSSLNGKERTIRFNVQNVQVSGLEERVITEVIGSSLLGETISTGMNWNTQDYICQPISLVNEVLFTDGSYSISICKDGGNRLLNYDNILSMSISPNPANDMIYIDVSVLETGLHNISIINTQGEKKELKRWISELNGNMTFSFSINTDEFSSGMYYILLQSPTRRKIQPVFIVK